VCSIGDRMAPEKKAVLIGALAGLAERPDAADAMAGVRLDRFESIDNEALEQVEMAFSGVAE